MFAASAPRILAAARHLKKPLPSLAELSLVGSRHCIGLSIHRRKVARLNPSASVPPRIDSQWPERNGLHWFLYPQSIFEGEREAIPEMLYRGKQRSAIRD